MLLLSYTLATVVTPNAIMRLNSAIETLKMQLQYIGHYRAINMRLINLDIKHVYKYYLTIRLAGQPLRLTPISD